MFISVSASPDAELRPAGFGRERFLPPRRRHFPPLIRSMAAVASLESAPPLSTRGTFSRRRRGLHAGLAVLCLPWLLAGAGCDMTTLAAHSSAGLFQRASVAFDEQPDYELARQAAPAFLLQFE